MTPRGTSLLGSLGQLLWSPSGGGTRLVSSLLRRELHRPQRQLSAPRPVRVASACACASGGG